MNLLAIFIVRLVDPLSLLAAGILVSFSSRRLGILWAAIGAAMICETLLALIDPFRQWGTGLVPGFAAAAVQASLVLWLLQRRRARKAAGRTAP